MNLLNLLITNVYNLLLTNFLKITHQFHIQLITNLTFNKKNREGNIIFIHIKFQTQN